MVQRASAAGETWKAGVLSPRKSPKAQAIASNARYKGQMQAAIAADSYLHGVQNIDEDAMAATVNALGAGVYTQGIAARLPKIQASLEKMQPMKAALKATIDAMANVTDADREARMLSNKRGMQSIGKMMRGQK
jgi:hypothetical protein